VTGNLGRIFESPVVKELGIQGVNPKGLTGMGFPVIAITAPPNPPPERRAPKTPDVDSSVSTKKSSSGVLFLRKSLELA